MVGPIVTTIKAVNSNVLVLNGLFGQDKKESPIATNSKYQKQFSAEKIGRE
jgi:hypothetical protein